MEQVTSVIGSCLLLGLISGAADAQDIRPLGVTGAELGLGFGGIFPEGDQPRLASSLSVDVAVTDYHGVQGDLSFEGIGDSYVGRIAGHLYLMPRDGQRYGVFAMLGDVDDRSFTYATAGVEGIFTLTDSLSVDGRIGLGAATSEKLDFIFGGLGAAWQMSPSLELRGRLDVAQFDEIEPTGDRPSISAFSRKPCPARSVSFRCGPVCRGGSVRWAWICARST